LSQPLFAGSALALPPGRPPASQRFTGQLTLPLSPTTHIACKLPSSLDSGILEAFSRNPTRGSLGAWPFDQRRHQRREKSVPLVLTLFTVGNSYPLVG